MDHKEAKEIVKTLQGLSYNQWVAVRKIMDLKFQQKLDNVRIEFDREEDDLFIINIIGLTREV